MKLFFYLKHVIYLGLPKIIFSYRFGYLEEKFSAKIEYIDSRIKYYCKLKNNFNLDEGVEIKNYRRKGYTSYYLDLKEFLYYFPNHLRFRYYFGDETHIEPEPTLFKARPIAGDNQNSVLFKLDKRRHFRFVEDTLTFSEKQSKAVFRGAVTQPHRIRFMQTLYGHPLVDAGQSNQSLENPEWQKPFMSVAEQLKYKFIICLEGNDVASNLKWAMSSNSVVITPKMKFETWFMEGTLEAGKHYIEVKDDYSDLVEKIEYYIQHPQEAEQIVHHAHEYIAPFMDAELEQLVCIKTLERYFELSGQLTTSHS
ncbi:lipopolysaccharide A protein [Vibrio metschnikovii]|uniref:glycosyl transferase family 90 n=1 Tax=Vibrio metschnikovii TaxID=28172 RepID=UPI002A677CEB|nr:lipopolysaccharide A protein [Vibrio metschnikovii]EKO3721535.1 lipopolysaccharide A protein [Vibrio metschnikovii]EKO3739961.1 lipopolysaccharide A protein [Vibrio metschnikovii]EKO3878720.1 lipopolysaccharide A protein [Vibrio metschnikovii]